MSATELRNCASYVDSSTNAIEGADRGRELARLARRAADDLDAYAKTREANASLIAAAPAMYEALKLLLSNPLSSEGRKLGLEVIAQLDAEQSQ
jgi:hypothetical protein